MSPRKSLQSSCHSGRAGSWRRFYLASVILCLLIKAKGVRCHTLLLDICFFQVEEMFKDCWMDLLCAACLNHYLKSACCNSTDVSTTNFNHLTWTTALFSFMALRKLFPFCCMLFGGILPGWQQVIVIPFLNSINIPGFLLSCVCVNTRFSLVFLSLELWTQIASPAVVDIHAVCCLRR